MKPRRTLCHAPSPARPAAGPVDWRQLVQWLQADGVISAEEAQRTIARCAQAESAQHPLVRLASVAMRRAADAQAAGYRDADPVAGRTRWAWTICASTRSRWMWRRLPTPWARPTPSATASCRWRSTPTEVTVATAEPFHDRLGGRGGAPVAPQRAPGAGQPAGDSPLHRRVLRPGQVGARRPTKAGVNNGASFEQLVELGAANKQLDANDQGVVQVVDWLWQYAFDQRASDIHLEPRREQGVIRFRIDGVLHPVYQMPMGVLNAMTARIKLLGRMDVIEQRRPQDGRIKTAQPAGRRD